MRAAMFLIVTTATMATLATAAAPGVLWSSDFETVEIGDEPAGVIVLEGEFTVEAFEGGRSLRLPGAPLGTHGVLLNPPREEGVSIEARIHAVGQRRRLPSFGVGLCGGNGLRLQVSPGRDAVELLLDGEAIGEAEHAWRTGWTRLRLELVRAGEGAWTVRGKVWPHGGEEPAAWAIEHKLSDAPPRGGASLWGMPYSGEPIHFDDVTYRELE